MDGVHLRRKPGRRTVTDRVDSVVADNGRPKPRVFFDIGQRLITSLWLLTDAGHEVGNDGMNDRFEQSLVRRVFDESLVVKHIASCIRADSGELEILGVERKWY